MESLLDDAALVERLRAGDEEAFDALVTRLYPGMLRFAASITGRDAAEEVVQDTWTAVIDGLDRFKGRSSLRTWVFRILGNRAKTWATRSKRAVLWPGEDDVDDEPAVDPQRFSRWGNWTEPPRPWAQKSPEEIVLAMEAGAALAREIDALPPAQRAVVTLRDVQDFSSEEVCDILGLSDQNQRVLLHRGRAKLRSAMERYLTGGAAP
jgi:RNA polymerase sigma-70 factor (ECF subfamily)